MMSTAPLITAKQHWFVVPFFKLYTIIALKRRFDKVFHYNKFEETGKPLLVLCNHISWWDGFWVNHWNTFTFKRRFYFMMLESQLRSYPFFQYTGGFSINPESRSLFHSLSFCSNLLQDPKNMVLIFPQGEIQSIYDDTIEFKRGIEILLQRCQKDIQVVFMTNFVEYGSKPKPSLYSYVINYNGAIESKKIEEAYTRFYQNCKEDKLTKV